MSVRLLKKVLKEQEAEQQQQLLNRSVHESDSPNSSSAIHNPFDLLIDDDNENHDDLDQGDELAIVHETGKQKDDGKHLSISVNSANHKTKKKKKKKAKEGLLTCDEDHEKSCDLMFENLSIGVDSSSLQHISFSSTNAQYANLNNNAGAVKKCRSSILLVDPRYLIAENELRRIFGSKVVNSFEKSHQIGNSRQSRGGRRGSHNHRRTILISPSDHWPRWDASLSMELLETKDGFHYFRIVFEMRRSRSTMSNKYNTVACHCGKPSFLRTSWTDSNPGRRFLGCESFELDGGCGFFSWFDPPMCERSKVLIPGLLRKHSKLESEIAEQRKKLRMLCFALVVSWVFFRHICIVLVMLILYNYIMLAAL